MEWTIVKNQNDLSKADQYVRSLRDAVKRRFAVEYLAWIRAGRIIASTPPRGALSATLARVVCTNLDELS